MKLIRRYIYKKTFNKVIDWAKEQPIRARDGKLLHLNFPEALERYLER